MSQENVEIVRQAYQQAKERGLEAQVEFYDDDAVVYRPEDWPEAEWVLVRDVLRVRGSQSGVKGAFRNSVAIRIRAGKVVEVRFYTEHAQALKAVGLEE